MGRVGRSRIIHFDMDQKFYPSHAYYSPETV
jgi:hypothetical protein